ncbi:hypothetical protein KSP39_PZI013533 [Platanthera zijinensis]|uniref:C2 domain-containing protein n=1 Tax=Platanthera zijinensis TaxID=2320716 RepID=A0AAP0BDM3_9ASPA
MSIQGQLLDVTVVGCSKLKDTEWISRQDPYVVLEYANTKFRTRTCTDGGKHPTFQEKTIIPLIEGLREITVSVFNSNTITFDAFIGGGRVQLQKVLSQGYDDSSWSIQSKSGKYAGEVKLILHFAGVAHNQQQQHGYISHNAHESNYQASPLSSYKPMAPPYTQPPLYPSPHAFSSPAPSPYPSTYPPAAYLPAPYPPAAYPPAAYPPAAYPPATYPPSPYPPSAYPPPSYPPAQPNPYHSQGAYPPPY